MTSAVFLQVFLIFNIFLIGALTTIAVQHAYAHFRPHPLEVKKVHPLQQNAHLPREVREHLLEASQEKFEAVLDHSAVELEHDLGIVATQLNKRLEKLGAEIVGNELERYHTDIEKLRLQAQTAIGGAQIEIAAHQTELKAQLATEMAAEKERFIVQMAAEKQQLIEQIDAKLADAVASFLMETLQHNVDLGSQTAYMVALLEEHKADFKRELSDEV